MATHIQYNFYLSSFFFKKNYRISQKAWKAKWATQRSISRIRQIRAVQREQDRWKDGQAGSHRKDVSASSTEASIFLISCITFLSFFLAETLYIYILLKPYIRKRFFVLFFEVRTKASIFFFFYSVFQFKIRFFFFIF